MITHDALQEAIAYYRGKVDPKPNDAVVLAACYSLSDRLGQEEGVPIAAYSMAPEPPTKTVEAITGEYGDSDFLRAIRGKNAADLWAVMDELMEDTLKLINPRLYDGVLRQIHAI